MQKCDIDNIQPLVCSEEGLYFGLRRDFGGLALAGVLEAVNWL